MTRRFMLGVLCSLLGVFGWNRQQGTAVGQRILKTQTIESGKKLFAANEDLQFELDPRLVVQHDGYDADVTYGKSSVRPYERRPWDSDEGHEIRSKDCIEFVQEIIITLHKRPDPRYEISPKRLSEQQQQEQVDADYERAANATNLTGGGDYFT